jgi:phosphoserine phosphatase
LACNTETMKPFSKQEWQSLESAIRETCRGQRRPIAAFDADGTLWNTDLGEALFDYQVRHRLLPDMPADPWAHYERLKTEVSHEAAYLWLAQINKGQLLADVQAWARSAVAEIAPVPVFPDVKKLIGLLLELKVEVYIVTASIQWAVEPGAELVGLTPDRVIGIRTRVENGRVTTEQDGPLTYRAGKVAGLMAATNNQPAFFCAGNTEGDLPLLESATHLRLVIAGSPPGDRNYATEQVMLNLARERGWLNHIYL